MGVVVRGDEAVVAHVVDRDGVPNSDIDTSKCKRVDGGWIPNGGGSGTGALIFTDDETVTVVSWCDAREGARAARYVFLGREQTFPVRNGHLMVAFDEIPYDEFHPEGVDFPPEWPDLPVEWILGEPLF